MLILKAILSGAYALLMLIPATMQLKRQKHNILMIIGALLLIAANFQAYTLSLVFAASGLFAIHVAALLNGKSNGKINIPHHLVRLVLSIIIFALFWFSRALYYINRIQ